MTRVVQKYGGSSVATPIKLRRVARRIRESLQHDVEVVVVVSAMGDTTDELIALAHRITADPRRYIALALTISATLVAPLLGLTLIKRATSMGALAAVLVSALVMCAFIYPLGWNLPPEEVAADAIFAAVDGFLAGVFASFLLGRDSLAASAALPATKDEPFGPD